MLWSKLAHTKQNRIYGSSLLQSSGERHNLRHDCVQQFCGSTLFFFFPIFTVNWWVLNQDSHLKTVKGGRRGGLSVVLKATHGEMIEVLIIWWGWYCKKRGVGICVKLSQGFKGMGGSLPRNCLFWYLSVRVLLSRSMKDIHLCWFEHPFWCFDVWVWRLSCFYCSSLCLCYFWAVKESWQFLVHISIERLLIISALSS